MLRINVMGIFINRLKDRGWKEVPPKNKSGKSPSVFQRGDKELIVQEIIQVDPTVDISPQIEEVFLSIIDLVKKSNRPEVFLPGGGDVPIPEFFKDFCLENGIQIHVIDIKTMMEYQNYN